MTRVPHNELECRFWKHVWFEVLHALLKMVDLAMGNTHEHENLLPPSSLNLMTFYEIEKHYGTLCLSN